MNDYTGYDPTYYEPAYSDTPMTPGGTYDWAIYAGFAILVVILFLTKDISIGRLGKRKLKTIHKNIPLLFSLGVGISAGSSKTPDGYYYQQSTVSKKYRGARYITYTVELPFRPRVHLLGIPRHHAIVKIDRNDTNLEKIQLEGDYHSYFDLYAIKGQDQQNQYIMDPKLMQFTTDFQTQNHWEIADNLLLVMSKNALDLSLIDAFIKEIQPVIADPVSKQMNPAKISYTMIHGRDVSCPVCHEMLVYTPRWSACPNKHGCLISGEQMINERKNDPTLTIQNARTSSDQEKHIDCPYCGNPMQSQPFQNTAILLEVCTKCNHRWVDSDDMAPILGTDAVL